MFRFKKTLLPVSCMCIRSGIVQVHTSTQTLAGHSKWANIKHIKGLKDAQRSVLFARLSRAIRLAVQDGGGSTNPDLNNHLRAAMDEALKKNMPNQTIQGVLKKCAGQSDKLQRYTLEFISDPIELERVKQKLTALGYNVEGAEHVFIPNNPITLSEAEQEAYDNLKEKLKNVEGVDLIYDNVNIAD